MESGLILQALDVINGHGISVYWGIVTTPKLPVQDLKLVAF